MTSVVRSAAASTRASLRTKGLVLGVAALLATSLAACGTGKKDDSSTSAAGSGAATGGTSAPATSDSLSIGTTDVVTALDPAGSYDNGSLLVEDNIYQFLMNVPAGETAPKPDAAEKCEFTKPTEYTCTLKDGQKFSNGDPLTAADVAFSFKRVVTINDPNGPASLLGNMKSVAAPDDKTVVFTLNNPNDQTFPFVLGTSAGPIVDSKVFPADKLLDDTKVIGSGPYMIKTYSKNQQVQFEANPNYGGDNTPKTKSINLVYYTESTNMKLDVQSGDIDIAWRSLTPTDVASLKSDDNVKVLTGSGGELRYLVFNFKTMPGGTDAQKLAVRKAIAYSVDRKDLAENVFQGTYQPAYSIIPQGIADATEPFKDLYGESPDKDKAKQALDDAGISTPLSLNIDYTTDHYGPTSADEYNELKRQLEATGLFKVTIQGIAYTTYSPERVKDTYPIYQLGWFPDYVDGDNYLAPFIGNNNFLANHYCDGTKAGGRPCDTDGVLPLLTQEQTETGDKRTEAFKQLQDIVAKSLPILPLLSGNQVAVTGPGVEGVQDTLDPTYQFRFWLFSKSS